ncbi:hypothetical protein [Moheibacter lacus]|uniref:C1q domain-containing protein n=1 Tax=Moheibacter lacus TaxID=2745851 RepID=A0A838ZP25_9FLAO|nr:hypothetical protein [Moheibacter lacus]MBA5629516.1 hypothetical protein [Moheibacter lacus]
MKNLFSLTLGLSIMTFSTAQVGIGTDDPQATLDINGNLKVRATSQATSLTPDQSILLIDKSATGDNEVLAINPAILFTGNSSAYSASKDGGWSLLNLGITGSNWYKINLTGADDTRIGDEDLFVEGVFTAQESGIYVVNYEVQLEGGVDLSVLGNKRLGLIKNGTEIWEEKLFDAVRVELIVPLLAVPVTSTSMSSLVELNAGETLTFAVETGGVNLSLLTDNQVSLEIYRLPN